MSEPMTALRAALEAAIKEAQDVEAKEKILPGFLEAQLAIFERHLSLAFPSHAGVREAVEAAFVEWRDPSLHLDLKPQDFGEIVVRRLSPLFAEKEREIAARGEVVDRLTRELAACEVSRVKFRTMADDFYGKNQALRDEIASLREKARKALNTAPQEDSDATAMHYRAALREIAGVDAPADMGREKGGDAR